VLDCICSTYVYQGLAAILVDKPVLMQRPTDSQPIVRTVCDTSLVPQISNFLVRQDLERYNSIAATHLVLHLEQSKLPQHLCWSSRRCVYRMARC
jgi:hypothetical protein